MHESPQRPAGLPPALIAPGITALAVTALLGVARVYDSLPLHPPPCGLRTLTGIPCMGCGGTRSMRALAHGDVLGALFFNPLVAAAAIGAFIWLAIAAIRLWLRCRRPAMVGRTRKPLPLFWIVVLVVVLVTANWAYLIVYLPK